MQYYISLIKTAFCKYVAYNYSYVCSSKKSILKWASYMEINGICCYEIETKFEAWQSEIKAVLILTIQMSAFLL